jgi:4a-hydroxytetrahydrobiopterin dehydratase
MAKLDDDALREAMRDLPGWEHVGDTIRKGFRFRGFRGAIAFVNRVADLANEAGHHPDLEVHYDRVIVSLSTHDEGGVTDRDVALARRIDGAVEPDD